MGKSTGCSSTGPGFKSQQLYGDWQLQLQLQGIFCPLLAYAGTAVTDCTDIHRNGKIPQATKHDHKTDCIPSLLSTSCHAQSRWHLSKYKLELQFLTWSYEALWSLARAHLSLPLFQILSLARKAQLVLPPSFCACSSLCTEHVSTQILPKADSCWYPGSVQRDPPFTDKDSSLPPLWTT